MSDEKLAELLGAEIEALQVGLRVITGLIARQSTDGSIARDLENAARDIKNHPGIPDRVAEYLAQMAETARKATKQA